MSSTSLNQYILGDEVDRAASLITVYLRKSPNESEAALQILQILSAALAKSIRCGYKCKSSLKDIFKLADVCCKAFSKTWICKYTSFMQYIQQICKYFILKGDVYYAPKLASYLFELKTQNSGAWNEDQKSVLNGMLEDFTNTWFTQSSIDISDKGAQSVFAQWTFLYSFSELNNFQKMSLAFLALSNIFSNVSNVPDAHRFASKVFIQFSKVIESLKKDCFILKTPQDVASFYSMLNGYFKMMSQDDFITLNHSHLVSFLNLMSNRKELCSKNINAVASLIMLMKEIRSKNINSYLKNLELSLNILKSTKELNSVTAKIVYNMLRLLSDKKEETDLLGEMLFKMSDIFTMVFKENNHVSRNAQLDKFLVHLIVKVTMKTVEKCAGHQEKLKEHWSNIFSIIRFFFSCKNLTDEISLPYLSSAVYIFTSVLDTYKKADLGGYFTAGLARFLIVNLRKLKFSSDIPSSLKQNVEFILSNFVKGSTSPASSFDCLILLIALTQETSPLFDYPNKFRFWTQCKLCPFNGVEDITAYHVINYKENGNLDETVGENLLNWPFTVIAQLDFEELLLLEIQSYQKHKQLKNSVLAVYKTAAAHVKCKITLARILCCATKFLLENDQEFTGISKFQTSVKNMIKMMSNCIEENDEVDKLLVLGDLNYMLGRCEINCLRREAQAKVVKMTSENGLNDSGIPLIEDPLNSTVIVNEFSFISYRTQEKFMLFFSQALSFWSQALATLRKHDEDKCKQFEFSVSCSLKYLMEIGYIYRLYKNVKQEAVVWQLLFDISGLLDFAKYKIIAFAELISILVNVSEDMVNEMKNYVESQPNIEKFYYFHLFQIAMGKSLLYNKKFMESKMVLDELSKLNVESNQSIHIQCGLYSYFLRSAMGIPDYKRPRELIHLFELSLLQSRVQSRSFVQETVDYCLLFDLALLLGRQFCKVGDLRYARLYSSKQWEMTQELHLPIRSCELLIVQAQIDSLGVDVKNVINKLSGIETIMQLSHDGVRYKFHPNSCTCTTCGHVEYQIALAYVILMKVAYKRAECASADCLELLKDCREVLSKVKKKLTQNYVTEFLDCDISFSLVAVEVLSDWGRLDKATKYSDHALGYIKQNYKPCQSELSSLNLQNTLKHQFKISKLELSLVIEIVEENEEEPCHTPAMNAIEITTPQPLKLKCHSAFDEEKKLLTNKHKTKKLIFNNTPEYNNSNDEENIDFEGKPSIKNINNVASKIKTNESASKVGLNVPVIVITSYDEDQHHQSPVKVDFGCVSQNKNIIKNIIIKKVPSPPVKTFLSEFNGQKVTKSISKINRKQRLFGSSQQKTTISLDSDEDLGMYRLSNDKVKNNFESAKKIVKSSKPGNNLLCKKLVSDEDSDNEIYCLNLEHASQCQDEEKLAVSSEDNSIIDATVCEELNKPPKLHLTNLNKISSLEVKMAELSMTPTSPLAQPIPKTVKTTKKLRTCLKKNGKECKEEFIPGSTRVIKKNLLSDGQCDSPFLRRPTRSSRRLLL